MSEVQNIASLFWCCAVFHRASGVVRVTKEHERRDGAQAASQLAIYYCCVPVWGRYLNNRSHQLSSMILGAPLARRWWRSCRGSSVWPLINSKMGKNNWKLDNVYKSSCNWPLSSQKQVRCEADHSVCRFLAENGPLNCPITTWRHWEYRNTRYLVMKSRRRSEATMSLRYLMIACVQVPVRKFQERLPTAWGYSSEIFLLPLSVRALSLIPRTTPKDNRFRPRGRLRRPLILPSIHLCSDPKPFLVRGAWWWYVF